MFQFDEEFYYSLSENSRRAMYWQIMEFDWLLKNFDHETVVAKTKKLRNEFKKHLKKDGIRWHQNCK